MAGSSWTFDELLTNGWYPYWQPRSSDDEPYALTFTFYRSEVSRHSVEAAGQTEEDAKTAAAAEANAWLCEHPHFQPRRPPAARDTATAPA